MDIKQIKELMHLLEKSKLKKMTIKEKNGFELSLEKEGEAVKDMELSLAAKQAMYHAMHQAPTFPSASADHIVSSKEEKSSASDHAKSDFITSPMVGTFYASPAPGEAAFIKVGDKVDKDTVVCIIEAMKVMNEVKAGKTGVVKEVCIENGHAVEFGTKLFRIE